MHELKLDATRWRTSGDVYGALLAALGAPPWHGHSLDALSDSLTGGDLNAVNPPLVVEVKDLRAAGREAQATAQRIAVLFAELAGSGCPVAWRAE
jgi:RNAse (barnase) inhibitor barstar